ncbi:procathepsin L-like [Mytilus trossulus]|uniref:procathepsin L-like n=1 Tax=Mytilus trossulus TaxID=6551 RepID=UPI003003DDB9
MKLILFFTATFVSASLAVVDLNGQWNRWKTDFDKYYSTSEDEANKRAVWEMNLEYVNAHNNDVQSEFRLAMNEFADQESPKRPHIKTDSEREYEEIEHNWTYLPSTFDWRTKGAIGPVQNQGQLGQVLSVAAIEIMESYEFIKSRRSIPLSLQEVVDCCTHGSELVTPVFNCIHNIGGLCSMADYPTHGPAGQCRNTSCTSVVRNMGTMAVAEGNEDQLQIAVLHFPVMAVIDASLQSFQLYRSGVYDEPKCSSTKLDHAVQIVGYGSEGGKDYWIVKNSWGVNWGMQGYILMRRNKNNQCGIASDATYPV